MAVCSALIQKEIWNTRCFLMRVLSSHIDSWINTLKHLNMLGISLLVCFANSLFFKGDEPCFFILISKHVFQIIIIFKSDSFVGPVNQSECSVTVCVKLVVLICCTFQNPCFRRALSTGKLFSTLVWKYSNHNCSHSEVSLRGKFILLGIQQMEAILAPLVTPKRIAIGLFELLNLAQHRQWCKLGWGHLFIQTMVDEGSG